ncbi:MAG: hypothetical protein OEW48_20700 [Phycisphaerae bacterium]|nr:hypothetical protein [Phycisphaerae bacterium]
MKDANYEHSYGCKDDHHHGHGCKDDHHHHHDHHTHPDHSIEFFVDSEPFFTKKSPLTANEILNIAGLDPALYYLVKIYKGRPGDSFEGKGDTEIKIENCDKFVAVSNGPTPVS